MSDLLTEKIKIKTDLLKKCQSGSLEEVYALVKNLLIGYYAVANPGLSIKAYRIRNNQDIGKENNFPLVRDFWFPQDAVLNRLNWPKAPVLYCSSHKDICFLEGKVKDADVVSICEWILLKSKLNSINMGFKAESCFVCGDKKIKWGDYRRDKLNRAKLNSQVNEFVDEFLFDIFTEPTDEFYKISASVGKLYLHNDQGKSLDAIAYPSVKCNGKGPGVNWAFSPYFAMNNIVPVCFNKYGVNREKPVLVATAQYTQDKLLLDAGIDWHNARVDDE